MTTEIYSDAGRHPMGAERRGDWIVIAVSLDALKHATETHDHINPDGQLLTKVTDPAAFADEFLYALNNEDEDGSTLITRAFDRAILRAVENGAEGIGLDGDEGEDE